METEIVPSQVASTESSLPPTQGTSAPAIETDSVQTEVQVKNGAEDAKAAREALSDAKKGIFKEKKSKVDEKIETEAQKTKEEASKEVVPPEYTPNLKYKVGGIEKDIHPKFKDLIKDKETEDLVRQLSADAAGVGPLNQHLNNMNKYAKEVTDKYTTLDKDMRLLGHYLKNDDFDNFFNEIQIPPEKIMKWVEKKLNQMALPPDQQAELVRVSELKKNAFLLEEKTKGYEETLQQQAVQTRAYELDTELMKPEVSQLAQEFDARMGRVGAFREECIGRGLNVWNMYKKDITPTEAVAQVMSLVGKVVPQGAPIVAPSPNAPQVPFGQAAPKTPPPVIPNITGHSTSPIKQSPKNLDDLRAMAKKFAGGGAQA